MAEDAGSASGQTGIRAARRSDLQRLADLRMRFLGEAAHVESRLRLTADARQRTEQALPVWMGQDERVLLVAERSLGEVESEESVTTELVGYAMGLLNTAPPVLENQHVGEILEIYRVKCLETGSSDQAVAAAFDGVDTEKLEAAWRDWVQSKHFPKPKRPPRPKKK